MHLHYISPKGVKSIWVETGFTLGSFCEVQIGQRHEEENYVKIFKYVCFVLVNNAGFGWVGPTEKQQNESIESMYATNVFGPIKLIRKLIPVWKRSGAGHALTVTSIAGLAAFPFGSVYVSTKFAMEGFMETVQLELHSYPNIKYVLKFILQLFHSHLNYLLLGSLQCKV